jgi:drug/metabolite transporter (DMT)-like permease
MLYQEKKLNRSGKIFLKWAIMIALVLIWGTSYILMKRGLESYPSTQVAALRIAISFLFLLPFTFFQLKKIKRKDLKFFAIAGLLGSGIPAFLFTEAQRGIDSQVTGILNSVAPLFTLIVGMIFFRYKAKWYNVLGVFIGLSGAIGLLSAGDSNSFQNNLGFGMYVILATILYATNINIVKRYLKDIDATAITCFAFFFIGVPCLTYLLAGTDFITRTQLVPYAWKNLGYITVLAVIGTALAGIMYNYLIKISSILFVASVTYLIPVIAIMWGIIDGEPFYMDYFLWIALIFIGVFLVNKEPKAA